MALVDPHSYCDDSHVKVESVNLELYFDFDAKILHGKAELHWTGGSQGILDLDSKGLKIDSVRNGLGEPLSFSLEEVSEIKGDRLRIELKGEKLVIQYQTDPKALALQWLDAEQTTGKSAPYIFTQCQPIHARSIFPCQDSPRNRITYTAQLNIPEALCGVMAAEKLERVIEGKRAIESYQMQQAIPTYLFAFAVGNLEYRELGPRSRVYGEPEILDEATYEFAGVEAMITTAESLFGPYDWERFDLLIMPSSFPYGGMENPRLTFLTPTVIAGDRSLVNILAHELAHSWTGNLVTNATMNDFWLNEGFTTYAERRILEALEGEDLANLHVAVGRQGLQADLNGFGHNSPLSRLKNNLENTDPDEVFSRVPYEKGFLFVRRLEQVLGRPRLDIFLKNYMREFRFQSITTEEFLEFLKSHHPAVGDVMDLNEWIYGFNLPKDAPRADSKRILQLVRLANEFADHQSLTPADTKDWCPQEWQIFLSQLSSRADADLCKDLDAKFGLTTTNNLEIRVAFLILAINQAYEPAFEVAAELLASVGRMKYLRPLYSALSKQSDVTRTIARETFIQTKKSYHPVALSLVDSILAGEK